MDDVLAVSAVQRVRDLPTEAQDVACFQRTFRQSIVERLTIHELHDDEDPVVVFPDIEECADMRMVERGDGARFDLESVTSVGPPVRLRRKHLHGDDAIEACVARLVDLPHPPGANQRQDFVRAESGAAWQRHVKLA